MEIILSILFVAILVGVSYLKSRIPTRILLPLALVFGFAMLIWSWVFWEGKLSARILVTVLILSGLYTTIRKRKQNKITG